MDAFERTIDRNLARAQAIFDAMEPDHPDDIEELAARKRAREEQQIDRYDYERG